MNPEIRKATLDDLDDLTLLFDGYAQFYRQPSNMEECHDFLRDRLTNQEAIIFIAYLDDEAAGFTLLYPSFSSVSRAPILILNDLFVSPDSRKKGIGIELLNCAVEFGKKYGAVRLHLETEISNSSAQSLYEKEGWTRDSETYHYSYTL